MKLRFGTDAADWQERIDFSRMRKERLAKTQAAMKKHDIAACLLTRGANIRYVTGVKGPAEFAPQLRYALAFAEDDPIIYELGDTLPHNKMNCPWVKPENWRFSYCWLGGICGPEATRAEAKKWAESIARDLKERGVHKEKLGVDGIDEAGRQALTEEGLVIVGVGAALREARRTKTEDEVNCLRMAIAISNTGYVNFCETGKPGLRECDLEASMVKAMIVAGAERASAAVRSGPYTFDITHLGSTDRLLEVGDLVSVSFCSTSYMGYGACIYRTFIVGRKPNEKEQDWYKRCRDRVYAVIEAVKPGATTADAAKHFLPARTWGYQAEQELLVAEVGHGMGMGYDEPVISRIWSLDYPQVFEPGMVIAIESREGEFGQGGVRLEEMVLVTETGHEILTTWPAQELIAVGRIW